MSVETLSKYFMPIFEIWTKEVTSGTWGPEENYSKAGDIDGLMENQTGTERNIADREMQVGSYVFYCLSSDWRNLVTSQGGDIEIHNENGEIYDVVNVEDVQGRHRVVQVDCIIRR